MSVTNLKLGDLMDKWWGFPLFTLGAVLFSCIIFWLISSLVFPLRVEQVKQRQSIEPVVHQWAAGPLQIIDIRTGTEINRIILGPDKQMIAERLYLNWEGEQEIRRIGTAY